MCILINFEEKALINTKNGDLVRPSCFDTLVAHDSYLRGKNRASEADVLLKKVFKGERIIANMIDSAQKLHLVKKE